MKKDTKLYMLFIISLSVCLTGCPNTENVENIMDTSKNIQNKNLEKATFAGGCFWCMEHPFEEMKGVHDVISGYTGGHLKHPSYDAVSIGSSGHVEAVQIIYDPDKIKYTELLDAYWKQIDPTDPDGSFVDRGLQYRSAIFYHNDKQKQLAEESKEALNRSGIYKNPVVTEVLEAVRFYKAEEYHQDYYKKNPLKYEFYRSRSGRDQFLKKVWDNKATSQKLKKEELKKKLTPIQYKVTQYDYTEKPYQNEYWDNKEDGIYVDIVSGEPLFSSSDKFDSKTGWPSFTKPLEPKNIIEKKDRSFFTTRTEVRSKQADSHLGHVFADGPAPTGLRYCINSASLKFIKKGDLEKKGLGRYKGLFK